MPKNTNKKIYSCEKWLTEQIKLQELEKKYLLFSYEKFYNATENCPLGISFLDENFNFMYLNPKAAANRGYPRGIEITSRNFFDFLKGNKQDAQEKITRKLKNDKHWEDEITIRNKNDEDIYLKTIIKILPEINDQKILLVSEDNITELKKTASNLHRYENEYEKLFNSSSDILVQVNERGEIRRINERVKTWGGYKRSEIIGKNFIELKNIFTNKDIGIMIKNFLLVIKGKTIKPYIVQGKTQNNKKYYLEVNTTPLFNEGKFRGAFVALHDVTQREIAEETLEKLNKNLDLEIEKRTKELKKAYNELKKLDNLKDEFLNISAHELKTPLTSIIALSELIMLGNQGNINSKQKKSLSIINNESNRLLNIIKKILNITRIEAKRAVFDLQIINPCDIFPQVVESLKQIADSINVKIICHPPQGNFSVKADKGRLQEVVYNLIDNALKFSPPEGEVFVSGEIKNNKFIFSVIDQGPGITKQKQKDLFKKFSQLDTGFARKQEGTGLGLYISKIILENMGGKIWVESKPGHGSTFKFSLPLAK